MFLGVNTRVRRAVEAAGELHAGEDAAAYAIWIGKVLPTESQWEYAARGGLDGATYAWGGDFMPKGRIMANTWHGRFPWENLRPHGFDRTSPVKRFAPNGYGLYDVAGNVWEWTTTPWAADHTTTGDAPIHACCTPGTENIGEHSQQRRGQRQSQHRSTHGSDASGDRRRQTHAGQPARGNPHRCSDEHRRENGPPRNALNDRP